MKKLWTIAICMMLAAQAWALTQTGMPALDELRTDVENNGPLSKKLGFTDEQRKDIKEYIDDKSEELVKKRDTLVSAEKKADRKDAKKVDKAADKEAKAEAKEAKADAQETKEKAQRELSAEREEIFAGLKGLMKEDQYDALVKWRAEGKANKR